MKGLTARQEQVLRYLISFTVVNHYQPGYREIGIALGITSTQGVSDHLRAIEKKGYIELTGQSRCIIMSDAVWNRYGDEW